MKGRERPSNVSERYYLSITVEPYLDRVYVSLIIMAHNHICMNAYKSSPTDV